MIKSFWHLLEASPGFQPDHLLTLRMKLPADAKDSQYREPRQQSMAFQQFLESVETVPGVESAAFAEIIPLSQDEMDMGYFVVQENLRWPRENTSLPISETSLPNSLPPWAFR